MAKIIETHKLDRDKLSPWEKEQIYNGLDAAVTAEVLDVLLPQLNNLTSSTYAFSRSLQAPVLEMRLRGVKVDLTRRRQVVDEFYEKIDFLETNLERIVREGVGFHGFNWRSNNDLKTLFYNKLGIPEIKRGGRVTVDRNALEKLDGYMVARQIVAHMIAMRDLGKKISVLKTEIDPDGRMRTSYNIAGTSTGRFSSSYSEFGTGGNLQNVEESLREIFIADPGMKMAKFDAKSGESYCVGAIEWNLFKDGTYLDACESGDPHTATARICWPDLRWTGDLKQDKDVAESPFYRHYTYRFMCKKLGHGSNYRGRPATLAQQSKLDIDLVTDFQRKYFKAYPAHLLWHAYKEQELRQYGKLVSLTGRQRHFFGRRDSDDTLREAMAYDPQCSLADIVNTGLLAIWRDNSCQLYMHDHDAITVQYPEAMEDEIIPEMFRLLRVPLELLHNRTLEIPYDCVVGWNRGKYDAKKNPNGMRDYIPGDQGRKQVTRAHILDR